MTHEFAHTLGITHCVKNNCVIGVILSLEELDSHHLFPCLEDCSKIAFACGRTLKQQLQIMLDASSQLGWHKDCDYIVKVLEEL